MKRLNSNGTSIIELIIGSVMVIVGVLGISLALSKSLHSGQNDRQRFQAQNILSSRIDQIKATPVPLIALTADANFNTATCSCQGNNITWATFPITDTVTQNNTVYTIKICTNRMEQAATGGAFTYLCSGVVPTANEQYSYRYIRAQVSWTGHDGQTAAIEGESLVGRAL